MIDPSPAIRSAADLDADYAEAGFDGRLAFGNHPALLVVDVVEAYLRPDSPLCRGGSSTRQ